MITTHKTLLAITLAAFSVPRLAAQSPSWRLVATTDELSGASDHRLILRSSEWRPLSRDDHPDEFHGAALIIACGDRFPGDSGRTVMFFAGEPMLPFGGEELAYADIRVGSHSKPRKLYMPILDWGDIVIGGLGGRSNRFLAFFGSDKPPFFSSQLFRELLAADSLTVAFVNFDQRRRTATFDLSPVPPLLDSLPGCAWPR